MVVASGADYIKFFCNPRIIKAIVGDSIKMKFSGAVNFDVVYDAIEQGCDRVGEDGVVEWLRERPDSLWLPEDKIVLA